MMKIKILFIALLVGFISFGQGTDPILTSEGAVGRGYWNKGTYQVDGDFVLPTGDNNFTNPSLRSSGKLRFNTVTGYPEYDNGNGWQPILDYVSPNEFTGTDIEQIQEAVDKGSASGKPIVISYDIGDDTNVWLTDEAILLYSNTTIYVINATIKLSDLCRDNMFRTANCGIGIDEPWLNPFENISIIGVGDVTFEGADNPRATSYNGRTLSVTSNTGSGVTFGTDALIPSEKQDGDWRSTMIIFAYTTNVLVENIKIKDAHGFAIGFERCHHYTTNFVDLDCPRERTYSGNPQRVFNCDGIKVMQGGTFVNFLNTTGHTDDNMLTIGILGPGLSTEAPGELTSNAATGSIYMEGDDVYNVTFDQVHGYCYQSIVRCLNTFGSIVKNVTISNITDTSVAEDLLRTIGGGAVIFGSFNTDYGGPTPIGTCSDITIDNVTMRNSRFGINIEGTLAEATISNFNKLNSTDRPAIYINPLSGGVRNLQVSNLFDSGTSIVHSGVYNGLSSFTGLKSDIIATANSVQEIILTGTSGTANINIDGTNYLATFSSSLTTTATNFISTHAANILSAKAVTATSHTVVLKFVHATAAFPTITITNVTGNLSGTVGTVEVINTTSTTFSDPNSVGLSYPASPSYTYASKTLVPKEYVDTADATKQATLVSGTNIKTLNGNSLLGSGDLVTVENNLTASTTVAPTKTAVNTGLSLKANLAGGNSFTEIQNMTHNNTNTLGVETTSASSASQRNALKLLSTTSVNMVDGFGVSLAGYIKDNAAVENAIGRFGWERAGADNTGKAALTVFTTGTEFKVFDIAQSGGTFYSPISMNSLKITSLANGTNAGDAINKSQHDLKADLASPTFTGDPKAPTPSVGDNDTSAATTAFVNTAIGNATGWAQYSGSDYTSGAPLVINAGNTAVLANNGVTSTITTQLPAGVTGFVNTTNGKITPQNDGDFYVIDIRFKATSSSVDGVIDIGIDIGGAMGVIRQHTVALRKGIGVEQRVALSFPVFSGSTFVSNGGEVKVTSITGNTSIYEVTFVVDRTHKAK